MNGQAPDPGWSGLFRPGERVRLRFVNAAAGTFYDVRIPGLPMTVVQVSGQHVQPVETDEFRIGIAETYDVVVEPGDRGLHRLRRVDGPERLRARHAGAPPRDDGAGAGDCARGRRSP